MLGSTVILSREYMTLVTSARGLVRSLFFLAATGNYHVSIAHIPGVRNCIADPRVMYARVLEVANITVDSPAF